MGKLICWLETAWLSIRSMFNGGFPIEGHPYYETYSNDDIQVLKCMRCERYSVGYFGGSEPSPKEVFDEEI